MILVLTRVIVLGMHRGLRCVTRRTENHAQLRPFRAMSRDSHRRRWNKSEVGLDHYSRQCSHRGHRDYCGHNLHCVLEN